MVEEKELKTGYRNGWLLAIIGILYIIGFFLMSFLLNHPTPKEEWAMGNKQFVPAESHYGTGYYSPADPNFQPIPQEEQK